MARRIGKEHVRLVNDQVKTRRAQFSTPDEMFTPDWDQPPGSEQESLRVQARAEMGNKMTPRGAGVLKKPI